MKSNCKSRLATLLRAPLYDQLEDVAAHLAEAPRLRDRLLGAMSAPAFEEAFCDLARELGLALDRADFGRHVELLVKVGEPYYFAKPKVGFSLGDFSTSVKLRLAAGWLSSRLASWFETASRDRRRPWAFLERNEKPAPAPARLRPEDALEAMLRDYAPAEREAMRAAFDALGDETWRLHVDWEDQEYGPEVYDLCKHNDGGGEVGYLESMLAAHSYAASILGARIDSRLFGRLHGACTGHMSDWHRQYKTYVRELWRPRDWADADLYDDIEPEHLQLVPFRPYEALAMQHMLFDDFEALRRKRPLFADMMESKLDGLKLTAEILNREFLRFRVCYFDGAYDDTEVAAKIDERFEDFYETAAELDAERRRSAASIGVAGEATAGRPLAEIESELLREIARLHRWCEYLRPFNEANTRFTILVLNKLLVEYGFLPTVLAERNDALFRSDRGWRRYILEGMQRAQAIRLFGAMGFLDHVLSLQQDHDRRRGVNLDGAPSRL